MVRCLVLPLASVNHGVTRCVCRDDAPLGMILTTAPVSVCTGVEANCQHRRRDEVIVETEQIVTLNLGT